MEQKLAALIRLQRIDEQIAQLGSRLGHLPQRMAAAERDVESCQQVLAEKKDELQRHRHDIDRQELELRSGEEHIERFRLQLSQVRTNREYQALQTEIKSLQADISRLEEAILEAMTESDELTAELKRLQGEVEEGRREVQAVKQVVDEEARALKADLAKLEGDRQAVMGLVDPEHLPIYERLRRGLSSGQAVVALRDEHCQGCHMSVPPQIISELLSNRKLITCRRCGRILYLEETIQAEEAPGG